MSARRIAVVAAVGAVAIWALKAVAIGIAGGLDRSPVEGPLFVLGLLSLVVAFVATGLAMTAGRGIAVRILGAVGGLLVGALMFMLLEDPVGSLVPESAGWVKEEAGLWAVSLVSAAAILLWARRADDLEDGR